MALPAALRRHRPGLALGLGPLLIRQDTLGVGEIINPGSLSRPDTVFDPCSLVDPDSLDIGLVSATGILWWARRLHVAHAVVDVAHFRARGGSDTGCHDPLRGIFPRS